MRRPGARRSVQALAGDLTALPALIQLFEASLEGDPLAPLQSAVGWVDDKTEKGNAIAHRVDLWRVQGQAQARLAGHNGVSPAPQGVFIIREKQEIINVAQVGRAAQLALDKMIKGFR